MAALQAVNSRLFGRCASRQRLRNAPNRTARQNMGVTLCTPLACIDGVLLFNEYVCFQAAHSQARAARSVRVTLGVVRVSCAADCAKGVRAKFRQGVARSELRVFVNFDLTPFAVNFDLTPFAFPVCVRPHPSPLPQCGRGSRNNAANPVDWLDYWRYHAAPAALHSPLAMIWSVVMCAN